MIGQTVEPVVVPSVDAQPRRIRWPSLAAAGVAVAVVRWWTSRHREMFHITPDEPGQLAIARFVGGMARWNMFDRSTWRPGYGTLIAPLHWLTEDPVVAFQLALVVNALLGGVACVLLCLLAHRLTPLSSRGCVAAGLLVALAPAMIFSTNWTWSEALVVVTALGAVLAALCFYDRPTLGRGVVVVLVAAAGFAAHSRLLPLAALSAVLVAVIAVQRRLSVARAVVVVAVGVVAVWGVARYSAWLVDRIWETPTTTNTADTVAGRATSPGPIAVSLAGQVWYQLVATAGVAGTGVVALTGAATRRGPDGLGRPSPAAARIVLVACGALVALAVVFMSDRYRPDQIVYGRYNDAVLGPIVIVGIGALVTASRRFVVLTMAGTVAVLVGTGAVVEVWRGAELAEPGIVRAMVLGLAAFTGFSTIDVAAITQLAAVVIVAVGGAAVAARMVRRPWLVAAPIVAALAIGFVRTGEVMDGARNSWAIADRSIDRLRTALPRGEPVRFRVVPNSEEPAASWGDQRMRTMVYQFYLPTNAMTEDGDQVTPGYVFGPIGDPDLTAAGAKVRWRDPRYRIGLWQVPT